MNRRRKLSRFLPAAGLLSLASLLWIQPGQAQSPDAPLGLQLIWNTPAWEAAVKDSLQLEREFDWFKRSNATYLVYWIANETEHERRFGQAGSEQVSMRVMASCASPPSMSEAFARAKSRSGASVHLQLPQVVFHYCQPSEVPVWDEATKSEACSLLAVIIDDIQDRSLDSPALMGYHIVDEAFAQTHLGRNSQRVQDMLEFAIAKIRERDRERPISITHSGRALYHGGMGKKDKAFLQSFLDGEVIRGWNILFNEAYIFHSGEELAKWFYSGKYIRPITWRDSFEGHVYHTVHNNDLHHHCKTSLEIEEYAEVWDEDPDLTGPRPEWHHQMGIMRAWWYDNDKRQWYIRYRRPTRHEYRMNALSNLAVGARGIVAYPYHSMKRAPGGGELDIYQRYVAGGLLSPHERTAEDGFRRPFSVSDGVSDYDPEDPCGRYYDYSSVYPFDQVAGLYGDLQTLLPILRQLRWWWAATGVDEARSQTASLRQQLEEAPARYEGIPVPRRFHLRAVYGEEEPRIQYGNTPDLRASTIAVGMFDDPDHALKSGEDCEYYLVVNQLCNTVTGDTVMDAPPQEITLRFEFADQTDVIFEEIEYRTQDDSRIVENVFDREKQLGTVKVQIDPGDGVLLRVKNTKQ